MLSVDGPFHESVTLVNHLIVPPRCGLRFCGYDAHLGVDQRRLWAAILAGLVPDNESGHSRLSFVTEGEASLHFSVQNGLPSSTNWSEKGM